MTYADYEMAEDRARDRYDFNFNVSEEIEVHGPLPGAIDRREACESLGYMLDSWHRMITPTGHCSYIVNAAATPDSIPAYLFNQQENLQRDALREQQNRGMWGYRSDMDERPYFRDPCRLAFDPVVAFRKDDGKQDDDVKLAEVWADPLARTFWLAIKARHITSQYFRGACLAMADGARVRPPRVAEDLHVWTGTGFADIPSRYFRIQIFPYVVHELMAEGRWPWFHPGKDNVADHSLGWAVGEYKKELDRRTASDPTARLRAR